MAIGKPLAGTYGVIAEFATSEELLIAANAAREAGYTDMDAYSPFPVHGMHEAVGMHTTRLPLLVLAGGGAGGSGGFFMPGHADGISSPANFSRKPFKTWPARNPIPMDCPTLAPPRRRQCH